MTNALGTVAQAPPASPSVQARPDHREPAPRRPTREDAPVPDEHIETMHENIVYPSRVETLNHPGKGELGIIPGSMGARSYIVRGLGNPDSFESAAHGAGRRMSRTEAKAAFDIDDVELQTEGVECRKNAGVIDELPGAYKNIDEVLENQRDLVEIVKTLKQLVCVKG